MKLTILPQPYLSTYYFFPTEVALAPSTPPLDPPFGVGRFSFIRLRVINRLIRKRDFFFFSVSFIFIYIFLLSTSIRSFLFIVGKRDKRKIVSRARAKNTHTRRMPTRKQTISNTNIRAAESRRKF